MKNKIKAFLGSRGITPYRFGRDVGISLTTAYALVKNPSKLPASPVLSKICDVYRIQPNEVLEWVEEVPDCV